MSDLYREAMLLHSRGVLESACAEFKMMLAVNAVRLQRGEPAAYNEAQIRDAAQSISHTVVDPRNFE